MRWCAWAGGLLIGGLAMGAEQVQITPVRDNSIYSEADSSSSGAGVYLYTGHTRFGGERRALLKFNVGAAIPAGSTIRGVTLVMRQSNASPTFSGDIKLRRVLSDWGEGTSDAGDPGGTGALATTGDATWEMRFFPNTPWTTPGGDFSATVSAAVGDPVSDFYTWSSTPQLVADVQGWLDAPATNFGWGLLIDDVGASNARRLDSREYPDQSFRPWLTISFDPPRCAADLDNDGNFSNGSTPDGAVTIDDLLFFLAAFEAGSNLVDLDNGSGNGVPDQAVNVDDLLYFLARFEGGC